MLDPFAYADMTNAMWVSALVGGVCGFLSCYLMLKGWPLIVAPPTAHLSCFLVLKGWALMGDAVSHAVLPGIVLACMAGLPLLPGAFVASLSTALRTGWLADTSRIKRDTGMGVVVSAMFTLGIVLDTAFPTDIHLDHILFGNMLGVGGRT